MDEEWELISRPAGKKLLNLAEKYLFGGGCLAFLILWPVRFLFLIYRLHLLYTWEGVWVLADGSQVSVRVCVDPGKGGMMQFLEDAFIRGKVFKEETNDLSLVRNFEIDASITGDVLTLVAGGDAKFPKIEVLDAGEVKEELLSRRKETTKQRSPQPGTTEWFTTIAGQLENLIARGLNDAKVQRMRDRALELFREGKSDKEIRAQLRIEFGPKR